MIEVRAKHDLLHDSNFGQTLIDLLGEETILNEKYVFLCIGSDRYIADSLGPLVGSMLRANDIRNVFGHLEQTVHAKNLQSTYDYIQAKYRDHKIIAIDACVGLKENIGNITIAEGFLSPGKGVGKQLINVGDITITGTVYDTESEIPLMISNTVSLGMVVRMSSNIGAEICQALQAVRYRNAV